MRAPALLVAVVCVALALGAGCHRSSRVYSVDEAERASLDAHAIWVRGEVVPGSLRRTVEGGVTRWRFALAGEHAKLAVRYDGVAPDTLREGNDGRFHGTVAVEDGERLLRADELVLRAGDARRWHDDGGGP